MSLEWKDIFENDNDKSYDKLTLESVNDFIKLEESPNEDEILNKKTKKLYIGERISKGVIVSKIIANKTNSIYSHVGISNDVNFKDFYHMLKGGLINGNSRYEFIPSPNYIADIYSFPITENQEERYLKAIDFFESKMAAGRLTYDFFSLIIAFFQGMYNNKSLNSTISNDDIRNKNAFICSAFVTSIMAMISPKIKYYLLKEKININNIYPGRILLYPDVSPEFRWVYNNPKKIKIPTEIIKTKGFLNELKLLKINIDDL